MKDPVWKQKAREGRHWDEGDARLALAEWAESGQSLTGFARRHELNAQRLSWWRTRVSPELSTSSLVPVTVTTPPLISLGTSAVRVTVGDTRIDVDDPARVPPSWLASLVSAMIGDRR